MEFEQCAGCPREECLAKQFFDALAQGEIDPGGLVRGRAPDRFRLLFIRRASEKRIELACSEVSCGMGDGADITW